jgi:hypothetical protein
MLSVGTMYDSERSSGRKTDSLALQRALAYYWTRKGNMSMMQARDRESDTYLNNQSVQI